MSILPEGLWVRQVKGGPATPITNSRTRQLLLPLLGRRRGGLRLGERVRHRAGRRGDLLLVGLGLLGLAAGPLLALRHHRSPVRGLSLALCRPVVGRPPTWPFASGPWPLG